MPLCKNCGKIFEKTNGGGRSNEKLCPKCWFKVKRGTGLKNKCKEVLKNGERSQTGKRTSSASSRKRD